jgi:hypothetical protein
MSLIEIFISICAVILFIAFCITIIKGNKETTELVLSGIVIGYAQLIFKYKHIDIFSIISTMILFSLCALISKILKKNTLIFWLKLFISFLIGILIFYLDLIIFQF